MSLSNLARALLVSCLVLAGEVMAADPYPSKPIKIYVGFAPGGGTDTVARIFAAKLQELWNSPVIVENKPGAAELLAVTPLIRSEPDGYTLWLTSTSGLVRTPAVRPDSPYDPLKNLTFIARVAEVDALYVVKTTLPVGSLAELVAYAKANPNKLNYGSAGVGSSNHLLTEQMKVLTGTSMTHVPYKNDNEVAREVTAGTLDFAIAITTFTVPFVKDGRIKALAVTGAKRVPSLPNVPTVDEGSIQELKGLGTYLYYGFAGPAGMPADIVAKLNDAFNKIASSPDVVQKLEGLNYRPVTGTPAEFRQAVEKDYALWKELGKSIKITNY